MDLSIIVPTFNERENVIRLFWEIHDILESENYVFEVIFVDDSTDDTQDMLRKLADQFLEVHFLHRENSRGLASAVVEGFNLAMGRYVIVMDSDLQHPPELIPLIMKRLIEGTEVVIPSRFIKGGSDGGLNPFRKFISWTARVLGQVSIKRLRHISDCTSGYFGFHKKVIEGANLDPIGWKILIEVIVKGTYQTIHEVPYRFVARKAGESKMSIKEQLNYLRHILRIISRSPQDRRFYLYSLIGLLGVFVNLSILSVLSLWDLFPLSVSSALASFIAMVHNYIWNNSVTWRDCSQRHKGIGRLFFQFPQYLLVSALGIVITTGTALIVSRFDTSNILGQLMGILIATFWSFKINNKWTWGQPKEVRSTKLNIRITREAQA